MRLVCWRRFLLTGARALRSERNRRRVARKALEAAQKEREELWAAYVNAKSYSEARRLMTLIMLVESRMRPYA